MELTHITEIVCPTCHAPIVCDRREATPHVNGNYRERREFACGYEIEYSPNSNKCQVYHICKQDPLHLEQIKERQRIFTVLLAALETATDNPIHLKFFKDRFPSRWDMERGW